MKTSVLALIAALFVGVAIGLSPLPGAARVLFKKASGTAQYLPRPDAAAAEFRRQRLALFRAMPGTADVVMLGDSHTEAGPWSELLAGHTVLNRGIGWDTTDDVLARLDEVIARKPKLVFLLIGIVDLRYGVPPERVAANIQAIAARLTAAGVHCVVQSVLPVSAALREPTNEKVRQVNELVKGTGEWLDLRPALTKDGALEPSLSYDGVHLSGPAYLTWARLLVPVTARSGGV